MALRGWLETALTSRRRPPRIYLHIGAMKTGTSYLQSLMDENSEELAAAGYLFPGQSWSEQSRAAQDVLEFKIRDPAMRARIEGTWSRVVEEMMNHRGKASVFSMEFLSYANQARAAQILQSFPDAEVHVILTVRDAATALPTQWQTSCRNAGTLPWPKMVRGLRQVLDEDGPPWSPAARMFQRTQGTIRMMDVWSPLVGSDRFHVITAPPRESDPRLLWRRFASVLGVDPDVAPRDPSRSNPSLFGHPTTEFLRLINVELGKVGRGYAERMVLDHMRSELKERARGEPPVVLHHRGLVLAARWNRRVRGAIEERGLHLVGEPSDLPVRRPVPSAPRSPSRATAEEILAVATVAKERLLALEEQLVTVPGTRGAELRPATPAQDADPGPDVSTHAVREVAELVRRCARLSAEVHDAGELEALARAAAATATD